MKNNDNSLIGTALKPKAAKGIFDRNLLLDVSALTRAAAQAPFVPSEKRTIGTRLFCWFWRDRRGGASNGAQFLFRLKSKDRHGK